MLSTVLYGETDVRRNDPVIVHFRSVRSVHSRGGLVSWLTKDYVDAYLDNAAYAKAITHPEMLDEQGNVDQTELLYLSFNEQDDTIEQDED